MSDQLERIDPQSLRKGHRNEVYKMYLPHRFLYTAVQWSYVECYYRYEMSKSAIAKLFGVSLSAVCGGLDRAEEILLKIKLEERKLELELRYQILKREMNED